jgi:hypothetical protein
MNYSKHYEKLIERAKHRKNYCYVEKHHIVPKCLGGSDDHSNIVELTGREHFTAHLLLHKIYPNNGALLRASLMMCVSNPSTHFDGRSQNRRYSYLREKYSKLQSEKFNNGGSPTFDKRWISNEIESLLVDKENAKKLIESGQYVSGKTARKDSCGHLVKNRCQQCKPWIKEASDTRHKKIIDLANSLYKEFMDGSFKSVCEFAKYKNTSQPRLTALWNKHIKEYKDKKKQGKSFKG